MANDVDHFREKGAEQEHVVKELPAISRRSLLKGGVAGFALLAGAVAVGDVLEMVTLPDGRRMPLSKGVVMVDQELCSGCRTCEAVCTTYNAQGRTASSLARIILQKDYLKGIYEVNTCFQCVKPVCLEACPVAALQVDKVSGTMARIIDERVCIGCRQCLVACGSIFDPPRPRFDAERRVSMKCHLCFGEAMCVKFCPYGALRLEWSNDGIETGYPIVKEG